MSYLIFNIRLSGVASGWAFTRFGKLGICPTVARYGTQNGVNPFDAIIVSGSPAVSGGAGAIVFATNSALRGSAAAIDMGFVSYDQTNSILKILVDGRLGQVYANLFTVKDGLTATPWAVQGGSATIQFSGQSVSGTLDLQGRGSVYGNATYRASFTGQYAGQSAFAPRG